jgi:hypothetical protein
MVRLVVRRDRALGFLATHQDTVVGWRRPIDARLGAKQACGTELATLFLAVPVLAIGLWTSTRG